MIVSHISNPASAIATQNAVAFPPSALVGPLGEGRASELRALVGIEDVRLAVTSHSIPSRGNFSPKGGRTTYGEGLAVHWLGLHPRARHQPPYDQHGR